MILFEKEVCAQLRIPSIPKREWDGKSSFQTGVAIVGLRTNRDAYAIATFDNENDKKPRITKVFSDEPFGTIRQLYVVPEYMEVENIETLDLDEASKANAASLAREAQTIEIEGTEEENEYKNLPEWVFDSITNKEEAIAWLTAYRKQNKIRGKMPKNDDTIKSCLLAAYADLKKCN